MVTKAWDFRFNKSSGIIYHHRFSLSDTKVIKRSEGLKSGLQPFRLLTYTVCGILSLVNMFRLDLLTFRLLIGFFVVYDCVVLGVRKVALRFCTVTETEPLSRSASPSPSEDPCSLATPVSLPDSLSSAYSAAVKHSFSAVGIRVNGIPSLEIVASAVVISVHKCRPVLRGACLHRWILILVLRCDHSYGEHHCHNGNKNFCFHLFEFIEWVVIYVCQVIFLSLLLLYTVSFSRTVSVFSFCAGAVVPMIPPSHV